MVEIVDCVGERVLIKGKEMFADVYEAEILEISPSKEFFLMLMKHPQGDSSELWEQIARYVIVEVLEPLESNIGDEEEDGEDDCPKKSPSDYLNIFEKVVDKWGQFDYKGPSPKVCFCVGPERCGDLTCPQVQHYQKMRKIDWGKIDPTTLIQVY